MKEMQQKDSLIVFYPTNKHTRPRPRTINNVKEDYQNEAHLFQEFFFSIKTSKQMIYKFDVTMMLTNIKMKQRMKTYLNANRLYMNSTDIDASTMVVAGWFENAKPELFNYEYLNKQISDIFEHKIIHDFDSTQLEQLNNLKDPITTDGTQ